MATKPERPVAVLIAVALLTVSCSTGLIKSLSDMAKLRQQLIDKYHDPEVNVSIFNSRVLSITFVNSALNSQTTEDRWNRAQETAKFAAANYPTAGLHNIWVGFSQYQTRFIVFHYGVNFGGFWFDRKGEPVPDATRNAPPEVVKNSTGNDDLTQATAKYNPRRNETDVGVARIQLEGNTDRGIAMVPHFTVPGDVHHPQGDLRRPAEVGVEFASYSDRKIFESDAKLVIRGDEQPIFSGTAQILTPAEGGTNDSTSAQFLTARIPFDKFSRMADSESVTIRLGPKQFKLSEEALDSLREMVGFLR